MLELRRRYGSSVPSGGGGRLPAGYQEVEWLMNKDGAYIETGVVPPDGCCFEVEAALKTAPLLQAPEYDYVVFGCDINYDKKGFALSFNNTFESPALGIVFHMSNNSLIKGYTGVFPTTDIFYKYKYENGTCIINNEIVLSDNPFIQFGYAIDIFALRRGTGHVGRQDGLKLKPLKLYTDTADIAEFIPCRRLEDNEKGMYDIVNDVFYPNVGTGEFLCGADVKPAKLPSEYQEVEYLKGDGSAYIAMNRIPQHGDVIKCTYSHKQTGTAMVFAVILNNYRFGFGAINSYQLLLYTYDTFHTLPLNIQPDDILEMQYMYDSERFYIELKKNGEVVYLDSFPNYGAVYSSVPFLFGNNDNGIPNPSRFKGIVMSLEWTNQEVSCVHFVPCYRKADDVAGMYDLVSGEFYTNSGTGEFIVGPDVIG